MSRSQETVGPDGITAQVGAKAPHAAPAGRGGLDEEHRAAAELAGHAGAALLEHRDRSPLGAELGREGDRLAHELLVAGIADRFAADGIRSEEGGRAAEASGGRLWVIDPLDGSREYSEGRDDWAVHVALVIDGVALVGAVALPALGELLSTSPSIGASGPAVAADPPRMVVSRTRRPSYVPALAERLGAVTIPMGSAGAKIAAVISGRAEIYVHSGGQYEWDSAAPVAVALARGLHASRIDGSPLRYAQKDPWLPDLLVCHPSFVDATIEVLRDLLPEEGP